jgi:hypothetical protein
MRCFRFTVSSLVLCCGLSFSGWSQETTPTPPAASAPAAETAPAAPAKPVTKKGKPVYTGPTDVIVLPPAPMLDEEGKQRLDPDGKPMFLPPVKQQRDKFGHPLFDDKNKPVFQTATELGYDEKGHKIHAVKVKPPKTIAVSVKRGVLTVDGLPGKAALNYEISDLKFMYFYAPWIGTAVVSNEPFQGAKEQKDAFNDKSLTVVVGEHTFQLTSENRLLGKKPSSAYVLLDRDFKLPTIQPVMGYGATLKQPYAWPGARANSDAKGIAKAPPLPPSLRPTQLLPPCPAGQMRKVNRPVLPGEPVPDSPCVPIVLGVPASDTTPTAAAPAPAASAPAQTPAPPPAAPATPPIR